MIIREVFLHMSEIEFEYNSRYYKMVMVPEFFTLWIKEPIGWVLFTRVMISNRRPKWHANDWVLPIKVMSKCEKILSTLVFS